MTTTSETKCKLFSWPINSIYLHWNDLKWTSRSTWNCVTLNLNPEQHQGTPTSFPWINSSSKHMCFLPQARVVFLIHKCVVLHFCKRKHWLKVDFNKCTVLVPPFNACIFQRVTCSHVQSCYVFLGGGFKHFLFSSLPGEMIQFD